MVTLFPPEHIFVGALRTLWLALFRLVTCVEGCLAGLVGPEVVLGVWFSALPCICA